MKKLKYISLLLVICLLFAGGASTVVAQDDGLSRLVERARNNGIEQSTLHELQSRAESRGISNEQFMNILQPAVTLAEEQLPGDLILQKAMEGFSKQAPVDRIVAVLNQMERSTRAAANVVDPWIQKPQIDQIVTRHSPGISKQQFRNELIKAASRGIQQEVSAELLEGLFTEIGDEKVLAKTNPSNIIAAVGILPDLGTTKDQPETSRAFVVRALKGGYGAGDLQKLPTAMNMAQTRSQLPAASVIEGVSNQMKNGVPAAQILQNLFNGNVGGGPPGSVPKGLENRPDNPGSQGQGRGNGRGNGNGNG